MFDLSLFHFIRPWALLLIIPAIFLYWLYRKQTVNQQGWASIIEPHLLSWMMPRGNNPSHAKHLALLLLSFWVIGSLALAGPTWKKTPQPVFSSKSTQVILLDLSLSMDADDIKPTRLERAKYKIKDYLKLQNEGLTGLVVYAGDGFILSPLTSDIDTIDNLLGALSTRIMPVPGSRPALGFSKAIDLLDNTGLSQGKILWFTDGADRESLEDIEDQLSDTPYQLNILALGTEDGSPIKISDQEGFLKDSNGNIVIPQLDYEQLASFAQNVSAVLTPATVDQSDVELMARSSRLTPSETEKENKFADDWFDLGYWLVLLLLPIVLLSFKHRQLLGCFVLLIISAAMLPTATASPLEDFFLNDNQQAKKLLDKDNPAEAYKKFQSPRWKAHSAYKMGSYQAAQNLLDNIPEDARSADDYYNIGNALALSEQYDEAIAAYEQALDKQPQHEDAAYNKSVIEKLKEQKDQEQQQKDQEKQGDSEQEKDQEKQENSNQNSEEQSEQQESQQSEQEQQSGQQQEQELTEEQLKEQFKEEEKDQEMEQWLRRLPDDPGGLLRRKMYREYQRRANKQHIEENW